MFKILKFFLQKLEKSKTFLRARSYIRVLILRVIDNIKNFDPKSISWTIYAAYIVTLFGVLSTYIMARSIRKVKEKIHGITTLKRVAFEEELKQSIYLRDLERRRAVAPRYFKNSIVNTNVPRMKTIGLDDTDKTSNFGVIFDITYNTTNAAARLFSVAMEPIMETVESWIDWELEKDAWEWFYHFNYDFERATRFVFDRFYYSLTYFARFNRTDPEEFYSVNKIKNSLVSKSSSFYFSDNAFYPILVPLVSLIIALMFLSMCLFLMLPASNKNLSSRFYSFLNKINSLVEYDSSSGQDIKKTLFIIFSFVSTPLYAYNVIYESSAQSSRLIILYILVFSIIMYSSVSVIYSLGYMFLSFLKGTDSKSNAILNFFFDFMAVMSFFARYTLQTVRPVLAIALYFLLHEYVFGAQNEDKITQLIFSSANSDTSSTLFTIFNSTVSFVRLVYEWSDFFMVFILQMSAFVAVLVVLFSFLFTSIPSEQYENFIKIKNEEKKKFL